MLAMYVSANQGYFFFLSSRCNFMLRQCCACGPFWVLAAVGLRKRSCFALKFPMLLPQSPLENFPDISAEVVRNSGLSLCRCFTPPLSLLLMRKSAHRRMHATDYRNVNMMLWNLMWFEICGLQRCSMPTCQYSGGWAVSRRVPVLVVACFLEWFSCQVEFVGKSVTSRDRSQNIHIIHFSSVV